MPPKVKIGSCYEPRCFTHRTATTFSAKMPEATVDGERIQSAFMADSARHMRKATINSGALARGLGAITVALLFGVWAAMQV